MPEEFKRYCLGPWVGTLIDDPSGSFMSYEAPAGAQGSLDLSGDKPGALGVFAVEGPVPEGYVDLGTSTSKALTAEQIDAIKTATGVSNLRKSSLAGILSELLTTESDPDSSHKPLLPTRAGELEIWLDNKRVWSRAYRGTQDAAWPKIQRVLQEDYRRIRTESIITGTEHHRRVLGVWKEKYGATAREIIPGDLPVEEPLPHQTIYTEDWNCPDNNSPDCDLNWTETLNDWDIQFNWLWIMNSGYAYCRAEHDLSGDDHEAQVDGIIDQHGESRVGAAARFAAAANTFYTACGKLTGPTLELYKYVIGARTTLDTAGVSFSFPDTFKVSCDGSTIKGYFNGIEKCSATDTDITGNTRCGVYGNSAGLGQRAYVDNFQCQDLAAASTTPAPTTPAPTTEGPAPTTPAPEPTTTTTMPPGTTTSGPCSGEVNIYINDILHTDLELRSLTKSYVRPWEARLFYAGRHDAAGLPVQNAEVRIQDAASGRIFFRGNITDRRPGGVGPEGLLFLARGKRARLEEEPVRINGRGHYIWNRRGHRCSWQMGEDSPGGDGGPWEAGEIIIDILEHALGLPDDGSDIPVVHGDPCCITDTYLTSDDIACYDATDPEDASEPWRKGWLQLDSIIGEFSVDNTPVASAIDLLVAFNGGFYGWFIDPETQCLVLVDMDACPQVSVAAGELGHWQDEAGKDYALLNNKLEWSLEGVCSTIVIQGADRVEEEMPYNIEGTENAAKGDKGELELVNAPWLGFPAAYHARCQPKRLPAFKHVDLVDPWAWPPDYTKDGYTPPQAPPGEPPIIGWTEEGPRVYLGTDHGPKYIWLPTPGVRMPIWSRVTGMIGFFEAPVLGKQWMGSIYGWEDEKLWGWYWARLPFTVSAGPDGDAYWWYGYSRTRTVYDPVFKHPHSWPVRGRPDDETAMRILAERLLRIYRDVRRQGRLVVDRADLCSYELTQRFNVTNLTASTDTPIVPGTTTTTPLPDNPAEWSTLKINAVEVEYDFTDNQTVITVANTFWMLDEYSELKRRLEMNLFAQRELDLSEDINECQMIPGDDGGEIEITTTPAPPGAEPTTTTGVPGPTTTTTIGPTVTTTPWSCEDCDPPLPDRIWLRICGDMFLCGDFFEYAPWVPVGMPIDRWCLILSKTSGVTGTEMCLWASEGGAWRLYWDPLTGRWWLTFYLRDTCRFAMCKDFGWAGTTTTTPGGGRPANDPCDPFGYYSTMICGDCIDTGCDCEDCEDSCCAPIDAGAKIEVVRLCERCGPTPTPGPTTTTTTVTPGSTTTVTPGSTTTVTPGSTTTVTPGSTTTTTPGPTTTSTPGAPEECPDDCSSCADRYYWVTDENTVCYGECDELTIEVVRLGGAGACVWEGGGYMCYAYLECASAIPPETDAHWSAYVTHEAFGAMCLWRRVADSGCPAGGYSIETSQCQSCQSSIYVYS